MAIMLIQKNVNVQAKEKQVILVIAGHLDHQEDMVRLEQEVFQV